MLNGLLIDPCIPSAWERFRVKRIFRGTLYRITVNNPDHVCKGVRSVHIDGEEIRGQVLPVVPGKTETEVEVTLGASKQTGN